MAQKPPSLADAWDRTDTGTGLADSWDRTDPTLGESIVETGQAFVAGAVNSVSEGLRGAGKLADAMRSAAPWMSALDVGSGQSALSAGGEQVARLAPEVDPRVANTTVGGIASGLGQVTGLMGIGALSPVAAAETAFLGGVSETERQVAAEMTDEDHGAGLGTLLAGGAIGAADMIPVGGVLARINRVMGGKLAVAGLRLAELQKLAKSGGALATAGRIAETTALEGATEGLQKIATNALVNHATDQELDLMRGVLPEGGMGGAVGGILASVVELATAKRRGMAVRAAKAQIPLEEYRVKYETDPVFRRSEEAALDDMIAAEYGVKLTEPVDSQVSEDPALFDDTQGNLYNDPVEGMRVLAGVEPQPNERVSRPARVSQREAMSLPQEYQPGPVNPEPGMRDTSGDPGYTTTGDGPAWRPKGPLRDAPETPTYPDGTPYPEGMRPGPEGYTAKGDGRGRGPVSREEAMRSSTQPEAPRYADGTLYEEGMRPNPAEYSRRSPGIPEGSQAPASPAEAHFDKWRASIWDDVKQGRYHPEESVPSNRDILAGKAQPKRLFRGVSDAEMNAARSSGSFVPIRGDGDLYVTPDPDRLSGGAYGAKGGGHIVEFDPVPLHAATGRLIDVDEVAASEIPMSAVRRIWTWDKTAKDHVLSYDRSRTTSPAAASGEQATVSRAVPLPAPSSEAGVPVQGQAGPQGQPVYPITGSSHVGAWGGTRENTIGAKSPTRRSDVAASITDVLERLGVRVERFIDSTGNAIVGIYRPGGLVQTDPNDIPAFAHELGHALHRVLMQNQRSGAAVTADWDSALTGLDPVVQGELRRLGAAQATGQPGRELTEGMAELVRMWVMSPEALTTAPKAKAWLEGWILTQPRAIKNAMIEAQQRARAYRYQGDLLRTQVAPESTPFTRTIARLRGIGPWLAQTIYDEAYAADRFDQRMEAMGVAGGISLRDRIRAMRNIARGLFTNFMHGAPTDFYGNHLEIPNFDAIVKRLGKDEHRLFGDYLHARATLAHEATGYNTGMAAADAVNKLDTLSRTHPHFEAISDALQDWFASVNKVLAAYSPTYAAEMARIEASDAVYGIDFYVPLKRYFSEQEGGGASGRKTLVGTGEVSRKRTSGSNRLALNPLESLANEARTRLERAVYRNAMESMVSLHDAALQGGATDSGADPWIREIHGGDVVGGAFDPTTQEGFEALGDVLAGPSLQGKRVIVQVRDANGRRRVFSMDPKIAALAVTVDPLTLRQGSSFLSYLTGPLSASRRALVATTITYNPVFQYFTNPLYDLTTAYLVSDYMRWQDLPQLVGTFTANVVYGVMSSFNIRTDKWETMYEALGLHASTSSMSELSVGRSIRGVNKPATKISNMFEVLGRVMSVPQRATQIALMQKAAKARGINIANMSETDAMYMRLAARQPVDYGAGSAMSRRWQAVVPFLRATLEGQKQIAEAWSSNRVEFLMKLGVLMALQTAVRYLFGDDDLEASKTADERLRVLSIPLSSDPDGEVLQIRIPSELAILTGAPAILIDAMRGQGADTTEMGMAAVMSIFPPTILDNPLVATAMQQISGKRQPIKSWFTETADAPLTPAEYEGKEPTAQRGSQTAPLVVKLAEAQDAALAAMGFAPTHHLRQVFGSPVRMESAISTALGGNALLAIEGFGLVPTLAPAREYDRGELTAGAFRRGGMTSWQDPNIRLIYELDSQAKMTERTRDGTEPEDVMTMLRRKSIAETAQALTTMRLLSTHEEQGMTVKGRRDLARRAQLLARDAVKELQLGGPTSAYVREADIGIRRQVNDINQGKFFK